MKPFIWLGDRNYLRAPFGNMPGYRGVGLYITVGIVFEFRMKSLRVPRARISSFFAKTLGGLYPTRTPGNDGHNPVMICREGGGGGGAELILFEYLGKTQFQ